ncbi:MAG TPA: KpsF/GutQ family sugar-phosphate isomerase [Chthonomonadaceae bacterium]|nr:KpsF/GutQ family sugar-phosphate isomerase [Chthonomonadaceae bacterium]
MQGGDGPGTGADWTAFARETLEIEAAAIRRAAERLDAAFCRALDLLDGCAGKVVTTGVGKSGMAARKLAATLTSTGCPAVFLHPSEAMHGDLGIVAGEDVVIALSNSGGSEELLAILPALLARGVPLIAIVGNRASTLAQKAAVVLDASVEREACPLNLAPTTSVVVAMALGDALAMTLQKRRGFRPEDYALNHPGGRLGRRLTLRVRDVMLSGPDALPLVRPEAPLMDVLCEISQKALGATCVAGTDGKLLGLITDFDVRRAFQRFGSDSFACTAEAIMTRRPAVVLHPDQLAYEALRRMEDRPRPISVAPVVDTEERCVGMVRVHDLVRAGL